MGKYTTVEGDTRKSIAERAGISVSQLMAMNPGMERGSVKGRSGQVLKLGQGVKIKKITFRDVARSAGLTNVQLLQMNPHLIAAYGASGSFNNMDVTGMDIQMPNGSPFFNEHNKINSEYRVPGGYGAVGDDPNYVPTDEEQAEAAEDEDEDAEVEARLKAVLGVFPWVENLGLGEFIEDLIINHEEYGPDAIVAAIRGTDQWKEAFTNIRREDGTLRMNEGAYLRTMDAYRGTLAKYGIEGYTNEALSGFLASDLDVNELDSRLTLFDQVQRGGADLKAAFYVYGGISLTDADLYDMVVDEDYAGDVTAEYYANSGSLNYDTFLGRVTDIATQTTGTQVDRDTAAATLDALLHGGDPLNGEYLSLAELTAAFNAAMIGSTATLQGLGMPTMERVEEFRQAGINQASAMARYGEFAKDKDFLNAVLNRRDSGGFSQEDFESASFLSDPDQQRRLQRGLAQEGTRKAHTGAAAFQQTQSGRLAQAGLSTFRN